MLSQKRPTANLVSRKVLTPLLGQIAICILIQAVGFSAVRKQPWSVFDIPCTSSSFLMRNRYVPPHLNREKSNVENSENTTLFLISCFEYILSAIVMSVGPPFRQPMSNNCKHLYLQHMRRFTDRYKCPSLSLLLLLCSSPCICSLILPKVWHDSCN